jgi:hypothetical protein
MRRYLPTLQNVRRARVQREAAHIAWMYQTYPWFRNYITFRPGREWQAVHLPSSAILPPARTPQTLHSLILADVQSRPVTPTGRDEHGEWTRVNVPRARPYAEGPPRGGGRL